MTRIVVNQHVLRDIHFDYSEKDPGTETEMVQNTDTVSETVSAIGGKSETCNHSQQQTSFSTIQ